MKKHTRILAMGTLLSFLCSSCGVMFGGSRFSGSIIAKDHPNAEIYVNGSKIGKGTAIGLFPRNVPLVVGLKQEGCEPKSQSFAYAFRGGNFAATIFCWGLIGLVVDLSTGASFKPDHRKDPAIEKLSDKNFVFIIDYSGCPNTN